MESSNNSGSSQDAIGMWLKRLLLLMASVLLAFCCWLVWRFSRVAMQSETSIVAISADVKQMSNSGAQISQHLQQLDERLRSIEEKAAGAMKLDEVKNMLDEVGDFRSGQKAATGPVSPDAQREIDYLLAQIRRSSYRFTYSDESRSGTRFYLHLYTKYKAYEKTLASAEDFIDMVGTKTITGHPYNVVVDEKLTIALNKWLAAELKKYRASNIKAGE